jgi:hypothetical protein
MEFVVAGLCTINCTHEIAENGEATLIIASFHSASL